MNTLVGCIDFKDFFFFFSLLQLPSRRFKAVVGVKSPRRVVSGVCKQKVGEYLIADLLTRPVFQGVFWQWALFFSFFFEGRGPLVFYHRVVMYIQFVELRGCSGKTGCYIIAAFHHSCVFLQTLGKWKLKQYFPLSPLFFWSQGDFFFISIYVWD